MKLSMRRVLLGISVAFAPAAANASLQINIRQDPGEVVAFTLGGDVDPSGLADLGSTSLIQGVKGQDAYLGFGDAGTVHGYVGVYEGPDAWGTGTLVAPTTSSGTPFALSGYSSSYKFASEVWVPEGYSGGPINSTATWVGQSFSSLGLKPGSYHYTSAYALDSIDVYIYTRASVFLPEPATWAMMLLGFGAIGFTMRRKRQGNCALA